MNSLATELINQFIKLQYQANILIVNSEEWFISKEEIYKIKLKAETLKQAYEEILNYDKKCIEIYNEDNHIDDCVREFLESELKILKDGGLI